MNLVVAVFILSMAAELLLTGPILWGVRRQAAIYGISMTILGTLCLFIIFPGFMSMLIAAVSVYRLIGLSRILSNRSDEVYLHRVVRLTSIWLVCLQIGLLSLLLLQQHIHIYSNVWLPVLSIVQLAAAVLLFLSLIRHMQKTNPNQTALLPLHDYPSLSVLIPARNESPELEACLQSILANDYPKLEVIVLDDSSHDKTPEIIRSFAHDGVRFVSGAEPPSNWLAKNYAYAQLANTSSGELILFCGVDVRLQPHSLRQLISELLLTHKTMLSILPVNQQPRLPVIQSLRYCWEMLPPRRLFQRPPVLSTCWIIRRSTLLNLGGLAAVSRMITPEAYFARETVKHSDGYRFMRSDSQLGVVSLKDTSEQLATAIRTRYPQLHRRPELILILSLVEVLILLGPFIFVIATILLSVSWFVMANSIVAACLYVGMYSLLCRSIFPHSLPLSFVVFPYAVLMDIILMHKSMWQYEFTEVIWKGRNISEPVMRAIPRLPKL